MLEVRRDGGLVRRPMWWSIRVSIGVARVKVETLVPVLSYRRPAVVVLEVAQHHSGGEAGVE